MLLLHEDDSMLVNTIKISKPLPMSIKNRIKIYTLVIPTLTS